MKLYSLIFWFSLIINHLAFCQTNIFTLSDKVGTEIDIHENRFYRIFPNEKGFISAQIIDVGQGNFRINIIKEIDIELQTSKDPKKIQSAKNLEEYWIASVGKTLYSKMIDKYNKNQVFDLLNSDQTIKSQSIDIAIKSLIYFKFTFYW